MILAFDLDDTLYNEKSFVYSGFGAVAGFLAQQYPIEKNSLARELEQELEKGRGNVFDRVLGAHNLFSKKLVGKCVSVYRLHKPEIQVYDDALDCLRRFSDVHKYMVTDGNKIVQQNKIKALNIEHYFSFCFISRRFGIHHEKPSPYCFQKICAAEALPPQRVVYVGDNPAKDFVGIKPLGFKTIRLMRGNHRNLVAAPEYEAHVQISSFSELTPGLLKNLLA